MQGLELRRAPIESSDMTVQARTSRAPVWFDTSGDWSWPGTRATVELAPPSWVPAFPPRLQEAVAGAGGAGAWQPTRRSRARRAAGGALLSGLAALSVGLAVKGPSGLERLAGYGAAAVPAHAQFAAARLPGPPAQELPTLQKVSQDGAGSYIVKASYPSHALRGAQGSFYAYLPPGYAATDAHYPTLYLLHGYDQAAEAFLQVGLQSTLDRLISQHVIPPMIAVMVEGGVGDNNWSGPYESYVLEVQQLADQMLPTIRQRGARAIAGDSMGGYGSMSIALRNPYRFGVVESWIGFFNGLGPVLSGDRSVISRLGLQAFVYGADDDHIANPAEDPAFGFALRANGAEAQEEIYPGGHSLGTVEAHLETMLAFAGRSLEHNVRAAETAQRSAQQALLAVRRQALARPADGAA